MVDYNEFVEFHKKHPDLDNAEYYSEFPETNKSTIRSWKNRAKKPIIESEIPSEPDADKAQGYEEMETEYIKILTTQTNSNFKELEGLDNKNKLIILKNRLAAQNQEKKTRTGNSSILPRPKPIGQSNKRYGIEDYIEFDDVKDEIRMEIPWDVLFNPKKNDELGRIK